MKKITVIDDDIKALEPKLKLGSTDWSPSEKKHIEKCYFEITKVSVGAGRTVDLACAECVAKAVQIVRNYIAATLQVQKSEEKPENSDWKKKLETIEAKAKEIGFEFPEAAKNKALKLAALEAFIAENDQKKVEENEEEDDLLGPEYDEDQLRDIIKAKSGEDFDPEAGYDALLEEVKRLEALEDGDA